jgi:hypothetical protein
MAIRLISRMLFAAMLCTLVLAAPLSRASLISNQGLSFSTSELIGGFYFQPIAYLEIGNADVDIGGFGVYGAAAAAGQLRWVNFDGENARYLSGPQSVSAEGPRWYDSPGMARTLEANHAYSLGVVASNTFAWGWNDGTIGDPVAPITQGGLTLAVRTDQLQVSVDSAGHFAGDPTFVSGFESFEHQTSLRVLAPIPEPAEWSMLIAGLLVIGFIAKRRNRLLGGAVEA